MSITRQWPDSRLVRLAYYLKHLLYPGPAAIPAELRSEADLARDLESQFQDPASWPTLPPDRLQLLVYFAILHYSFTNDEVEIPPLTELYRLAIERLDLQARLQLEADVADVLDSDVGQLNALMPFIFHDPDLEVVSSASLDLATLTPLKDEDPMTGAKAAYDLAATWADNDEPMAAGILAGILLLGDWRTLPILDGCWQTFGPVGQQRLTQAKSGRIYASVVEFYLRWLEAVDERDFGFPAGALARLAEGAVFHANVRDVERRFPAPFNLPPEEYQRNPPITLIQEWTIDEYARIIEPRLRMLYLRETYDKVMPRVLEAWGLEIGEDTKEDQFRRIAERTREQVAALRGLASDPEVSPPSQSVDDDARQWIAHAFSTRPAPEALDFVRVACVGLERQANDLWEQTRLVSEPSELQELRSKYLALVEGAQVIRYHLRQHLGPNLDAAGTSLTAGLTSTDYEDPRPVLEAALRQTQATIATQPAGQPPDARAHELMAPLARLADDIAADATGLTPDQQARKLLATLFTNPPSPGVALNTASAMLMTLSAKAERLRAEAAAAQDAATRNRLLTEATTAVQQGDAISHHLRQHFGPDLDRIPELWDR